MLYFLKNLEKHRKPDTCIHYTLFIVMKKRVLLEKGGFSGSNPWLSNAFLIKTIFLQIEI